MDKEMNTKDLPDLTQKDLERIQAIVNSATSDIAKWLSIPEVKAGLIEMRVRKAHHLRAIKNGVQFDENGEITSFSPETNELFNRAKEIK